MNENKTKPLDSRQNNFNIIRLFAALLVLIYHANVFFHHKLPHGVILGQIAVGTFFMISGYLITGSFFRQKTLDKYIKARIFRIFPALIAVNFLVAFALGPIISNVSISDYFLSPTPYTYFIGTSLLYLGGHGTLVGVNKSPNGSLWTLLFEFIAYLGTAFLGKFKLLKTPIILGGIILLYIISQVNIPLFKTMTPKTFTILFIAYGFGTIVYLHQNMIIKFIRTSSLSLPIAVISLIIVTLFIVYFDQYFLYMIPFLTVLIFYLAFTDKIRLYNFGKNADWSYGVYIYAWPITLTLHQFSPRMNVWIADLIIIIISIFFAHLSYKFIEKPMMLFGKKEYILALYK